MKNQLYETVFNFALYYIFIKLGYYSNNFPLFELRSSLFLGTNPRWLLLHLADTKESTYYLLDFQNIFSNSIHSLLLKSKTIDALFFFLLMMIVSKAITLPLKDPNELIILRTLTVILPSFGLGNRTTLETYTTGRYCWARNVSQRTYMCEQ